jgi:hypothetical protein
MCLLDLLVPIDIKETDPTSWPAPNETTAAAAEETHDVKKAKFSAKGKYEET